MLGIHHIPTLLDFLIQVSERTWKDYQHSTREEEMLGNISAQDNKAFYVDRITGCPRGTPFALPDKLLIWDKLPLVPTYKGSLQKLLLLQTLEPSHTERWRDFFFGMDRKSRLFIVSFLYWIQVTSHGKVGGKVQVSKFSMWLSEQLPESWIVGLV